MQINVTRAAILKKYLRKYFRQYFANDAGDKQVELRNSLTVSPISFDSSSTSIINEFSIFIIDEFSSLVNFSSEQTTIPFVVSAEDILRENAIKNLFLTGRNSSFVLNALSVSQVDGFPNFAPRARPTFQ